MNPAQLTEFLQQRVGLFRHFSAASIAQIVHDSTEVPFAAQATVMQCGEDATFLGVLLEGELTVRTAGDEAAGQVLGKFSPGDTFGEMALMSGEKTIAEMIASKASRVLRIPEPVFRSAILAEPKAVQHISKTLADRFRQLAADPAKAAAAFRRSDDPYGLNLKSERPEKILVINCGSSSLKYTFFDTTDLSVQVRGLIERIGVAGTRLKHRGPKGEQTRELPQGGHKEAFQAMLETLTAKDAGVIQAAADITLVGHRVVHGGERFSEAVLIDEAVLKELAALSPLAPLHNPVNLVGIEEARRVFSAVPHVAVFDTAFHHTLPAWAYLYGLPYEYHEKKGVRRYGFHGSSHAFVSLRAAQHQQRRLKELKLVSCHLGNGASLSAVDHGSSVDTSMGFTPGEGLIMGTRCGDLDAGVVTYLEREQGLTAAQIDDLLNKKSGLLGLSGTSGDMREIEKAAEAGDARALLALKAFCYRVRKYIGAYLAAMGGMDVLVFTGGIGQGSAGVRSLALQGLRCMGIHLDEERNRSARSADDIVRISTDDSPVAVLVVPTDEERMIAREALRTLSHGYLKGIVEAHKKEPILIEVSAHHIHLTQAHVEALFGAGHQLTRHSDLSQPGQYACKEQLAIVGPKGRIERVRVLGPVRKATQVEISMTEQFKLGIHPPIRESGDIEGSPGCKLECPTGSITIDRGVICAMRHIHMTPSDALRYGVKDKSTVRIRVPGDRELIFGDVRVRVSPDYSLAMHIDTDEANAANLKDGTPGHIDGIQSQD